jgi:hypothetical protein
MRLHLDQRLPFPPDAAWPFVSEPDRINFWSTARVQTVYSGDGGEPSTVGALRRLRVPTRPKAAVFDEVIEHSEPPGRFVYRVIGQRTVRYHRGEILLRPEGSGALLTWDVEFVFAYAGMAAALRRVLEPQLVESLRRLSELTPNDTAPRLVSTTRPDEDHEVPALLEQAGGIEAEQRILADRLEAAGDPRHWFARIYEYVTASLTVACGEGSTVTHRAWVLRLIPRFHGYWLRNVEAAENQQEGRVEDHWRSAFAAIESADAETGGSPIAFWTGLVQGARAHIEGDLPRVLADVYLDHYVEVCRYARFRADFLLLLAPFREAWDRLAERVPPRYFPRWMAAVQRAVPPEAVEALLAHQFWDPVPPRRLAFERGRELVEYTRARSALGDASRTSAS